MVMKQISIMIACICGACVSWAASGGAAARPSSAGYTPPVSKYPLHYPAANQTRSVMRTVREQIGLTTQDMQTLGLSYDEVLAVLKVVHDWVEPRRAAIERSRDEFIAARGPFMSTQGKIYSLEQRLARLDASVDADPGLESRLRAELDRHRAELPAQQKHFETIHGAYGARFESLIAPVDHVLSLPQRQRWAASRRNKALGLPVTLQFMPDVTREQIERLGNGVDSREVFTQDQQAVNAAAMRDYVTHKNAVYRAEMKFFFGRDIEPADEPQVRTVAHDVSGDETHPPAPKASAGSRCPFSALFGKQSPHTRPGD